MWCAWSQWPRKRASSYQFPVPAIWLLLSEQGFLHGPFPGMSYLSLNKWSRLKYILMLKHFILLASSETFHLCLVSWVLQKRREFQRRRGDRSSDSLCRIGKVGRIILIVSILLLWLRFYFPQKYKVNHTMLHDLTLSSPPYGLPENFIFINNIWTLFFDLET